MDCSVDRARIAAFQCDCEAGHLHKPIECRDKLRTEGQSSLSIRQSGGSVVRELRENRKLSETASLLCEERKKELEDLASAQIGQLEDLNAFLQKAIPQYREEVRKRLCTESLSGNSIGNLLWQASHSSDYSQLRRFEFVERE